MGLSVPDGSWLLFLTVYTALFVTAFEATILAIVWRLRPLLRLVPMLATMSRDELEQLGKFIADFVQERRELAGGAHVHRRDWHLHQFTGEAPTAKWWTAQIGTCRRCGDVLSVELLPPTVNA